MQQSAALVVIVVGGVTVPKPAKPLSVSGIHGSFDDFIVGDVQLLRCEPRYVSP
jgi:hypothetical protein